jgi:hypothetical protein
MITTPATALAQSGKRLRQRGRFAFQVTGNFLGTS